MNVEADRYAIRPLSGADSWILEEATLLNVNWNDDRFTMGEVRDTPQLAHYTTLIPERGDFGFTYYSSDSGRWLSVVWLLFLGEDDPGYGYVREGVPELSLSTMPGSRRRGLGRRLLKHAIATSRARGLEAVSLSVEARNPARQLYLSTGFTDVPEKQEHGTMMLSLSN